MLKIIVCVKAVPDPKYAEKIKIDPVTRTLMRGSIPLVMNPLDKHAMEAALQLKEQVGGHITTISMGPSEAERILRESLALGADRGVLLSDRAFAGADAYATAYTLSRGIEKLGSFDLVLCGAASSDGSTEIVGPEIGVFLDIPVVTMVKEVVSFDGDSWKVKAAIDDGFRLVQVKIPLLLTTTRDLNQPRALGFSGIIQARKKEIIQWGAIELGVPVELLGLKGSPTIVSKMEVKESKRKVEQLSGTREEKAEKLVSRLIEAGFI